MKKLVIAVLILVSGLSATAQTIDMKPVPQITVQGEGKVSVEPDRAVITIGVETLGANASQVKKDNDAQTEKVVQFLKKANLPKGDVQTQRVSLQPNYDYDKKKYTYRASQTIEVTLRDLSRYDELMAGLTESGVNLIQNITFESSKIEEAKSQARKLAIQDAQRRAQDFVSVLSQKAGKAIMITDNSAVNYPPAPMYRAAMAKLEDGTRETLAVGTIEATSNVQVSFALD